MCGIAGIHIKDPSKGLKPEIMDRLVNQLLLGIEPRGRDATGMVAVTAGGKKVILHKSDEEASSFIKTRPSIGGTSDIRTVLLHTRFATQGHQSNNANNHPVLYKTCFATHNGHINNDSRLFAEFDLRRNAEVDSEIIAALFSEFGLDKAHKALQELEGNMAVAVIDPVVAPDKLILAKGFSSPLIFHDNPQFIMWASSLSALKQAWGSCLGTPPQPKKFWELQEGGLLFVDGGTTELLQFKPKATYSGWQNYSSSGERWEHRPKNASLNCKACGCTGFWHTGHDYMGSCMNRPEIEGQKWSCRCEGFVYKEEDEPAVEEKDDNTYTCDLCEKDCLAWEGDQVWGNCWLCESCLEANDLIDSSGFVRRTTCDTDYEDGATKVQRKAEGDFHYDVATTKQLALVSSKTCTHESCDTDKCFVPPQVEVPDSILGIKVFADDVDPAEPGIWVPTTGFDNEARHTIIMDSLAATSGFHKAFIQWILFEAPLEVADGDEFLTNARNSLDEAYADKEMDINTLEADAYASNMRVH